MECNSAITLNQNALRRVVEEIFALLELVLNGTIIRLPHVLQVAAYRLLIPAEAALRRLIVIAAREVKVKLPPPRLMPKGKIVMPKGNLPLSFQLYDARKRFDRVPTQKKTLQPRIHFFDAAPIIPPPAKKQQTSLRLCRRFAAFKLALENIPQQAKRLALWKAKRALKEKAKFRFPLRSGAPPGWHLNLAYDVDHILKECHALAIRSQRASPS